MRTLTMRIVLCFLLVARVAATPVFYEQVVSPGQPGQQPAAGQKNDPPQLDGRIPDSGDRPEFVRLADGRLVPYGPGIICADDCLQAEALALDDPLPSRLFNPWVWALPAVVGGVVTCVVLCRGESTPPIVTTPPTILTPPPPPPPIDVPEPATLVLLGLGLALLARYRFGPKKTSAS